MLFRSDAAKFHEESRSLFQSAGWDLQPGGDSTSDTVTKGWQELYLHPMNFSGIIEMDEIPAIQELLKDAKCVLLLNRALAQARKKSQPSLNSSTSTLSMTLFMKWQKTKLVMAVYSMASWLVTSQNNPFGNAKSAVL